MDSFTNYYRYRSYISSFLFPLNCFADHVSVWKNSTKQTSYVSIDDTLYDDEFVDYRAANSRIYWNLNILVYEIETMVYFYRAQVAEW